MAPLPAPIGEADHLAAQPIERLPKLDPVLLDRCPDLLRAAGRHQPVPSDFAATVSRIFLASSKAIFGVGAPTRNLRHANRKAPIARTASTPVVMAKPIQMSPATSPMIASMPQARASRARTSMNTPNTAPAAIAAAPRAMLATFTIISALASSISSRTSRLMRSETCVTVVPSVSGFPFSAGKAFQERRDQEPAGEGGPDQNFRTFGGGPGGRLLGGGLRRPGRRAGCRDRL